MIKVDVVSGFLGAGKTTVIRRLIQGIAGKEKVVLIENEFGEIGVDGSFLKEAGIQIREINSGCICCSLVGDFSRSIHELIETYHPERIIIEPSGVGKLSDIIRAIENTEEHELQWNILVTVVDGPKAKIQRKNFGEFFINQVQSANTIIISKTDKMSEEKVQEVVELLKQDQPHANMMTTGVNDLSGEKLLSILEEKGSLQEKWVEELKKEHHHSECCDGEDDECCCHEDHEEHECCGHHHHDEEEHECCGHHHHDDDEHECCGHHHHDDDEHECCGHHHHDEDEHECCGHHHHDEEDDECCCGHHEHHHHHHDADEVFASWGKETAASISYQGLREFLEKLKDESLGIIVRSKGILKARDQEKWYYFDYVYGDYEIREGEPDYTGRICVIGSKLQEEAVEALFQQCKEL